MDAGDVNTYRPDPADAGRVVFARTNLVQFTINLDAENLVVNGLGGDDTMSPDAAAAVGLDGRTTLLLTGGAGNDTITGGDGSDTIQGDEGTDTLTAAPTRTSFWVEPITTRSPVARTTMP